MRNQVTPKDTAQLPSHYVDHHVVDLKKNRKFSIAVQGLFVLVSLVAVGIALLLGLPLDTGWSPLLSVPVTLIACLLYMAAHEATHGIVLHGITGLKPFYNVRFPFLTTGSHAYLTRRSAVIVALAPAVFWGLVLIAALLVLPQNFLMTVFVLVALNFAASAGDYVEAFVVSRQQPDALVQDKGDAVHVFIPRLPH